MQGKALKSCASETGDGNRSPLLSVAVPGRDLTLKGVLHRAAADDSAPCVVLCHGLMSSMESPKFRLLGEVFRAAGVHSFRFDFSGCGASDGRLAETTVTGRIADLQAVLDHLHRVVGLSGAFGLLGSSLGGHIAGLVFGRRTDVQALCLWATPFDLTNLRDHRDHPDLAVLNDSFFEDLTRYGSLSGDRALSRVLVLHGMRDEIVPPSHAFRIYRGAHASKALRFFPQGDHRFSDPALRREAAELSLNWFRTTLFAAV
jgi:alpha-beta hydrolase superfamily lysophospholipase